MKKNYNIYSINKTMSGNIKEGASFGV